MIYSSSYWFCSWSDVEGKELFGREDRKDEEEGSWRGEAAISALSQDALALIQDWEFR